MDPGCVLAACSPPWSRGFAYEIQRGAKVWGFGLTPSVAVIPPDCGSGKVFIAVVEHSRLPPWGAPLPAPSPASRGQANGRATADVSGCPMAQGPPGWHWDRHHRGDKGTLSPCCRHEAALVSGNSGAGSCPVTGSVVKVTCGWGGRSSGGRARHGRRSSPATSWGQGSPGPR